MQPFGHFSLQAICQPFFQLVLRGLRNVDEANACVPGSIGPGDFAGQFQRNARTGKRESKLPLDLLGQLSKHTDGHAPLAEVGRGRGHFLFIRQADPQWYVHGMAEVPPTLPHHEIQRGIETTRSVQGAKRLLQNEVRSPFEGLLGGRLPIQNRERDRLAIALRLAQVSEKVDPALQVVAVDDDRVKLALRKQITCRLRISANLETNRDLLQRRIEYGSQSLVPTDEKRIQIHASSILPASL